MKKTLVFGASLNPGRYSNLAIRRLRQMGVDTVAFGLRKGWVDGIEVLTSVDNLKEIDTITLYMNPQRQKLFYDTILGISPKRVIFNPGTENPEFYEKLKGAGIEVEVSCTLVMLATGQY